MILNFYVVSSILIVLGSQSKALSEPLFDAKDSATALTPDEMSQAGLLPISHDIPSKQNDPILNPQYQSEPEHRSHLVQGDIVISSELPTEEEDDSSRDVHPKFRNAIRLATMKWPEGKVPYIISDQFSSTERLVIAGAMKQYHNKTCIKFIPRTTQADYLYIMKGSGCYSHIGKDTTGPQKLSLGDGCVYTGIAIHELMHAIGFWHEQSRTDRDTVIEIMWDNIQQSMAYNFDKMGPEKIQSLGEPYDTCSVMHYNAYAFSIYPMVLPTIRLRANQQGQHHCELGQRNGFSEIDLKKINKLYQCDMDHSTTNSGSEESEECEDLNKKHCSYWASHGECEKNPSWMLPNCAKSCNQCELKCKDYSKHCKRWAELGECTKNSPYMEAYCYGSCHCQNDCQNQHKNCDYWSKNGYCNDIQFGDFMELRCKKSCGFC